MSECPSVRVSECLRVWMSECLNVWMSECLNHKYFYFFLICRNIFRTRISWFWRINYWIVTPFETSWTPRSPTWPTTSTASDPVWPTSGPAWPMRTTRLTSAESGLGLSQRSCKRYIKTKLVTQMGFLEHPETRNFLTEKYNFCTFYKNCLFQILLAWIPNQLLH